MRKREQLSLESRDVIVATEQEEDDCSEDPLEETQLVGIEMRRMKGRTLKDPRASLEVKYLIIDLLELEGEEKKDVLQILEIKVQEERGGRQAGGKKNRIILKMAGKSDFLKKIWEGMTAPVKEHGGSMSFIQVSEASTPAKETANMREVTRLEEASERARKEVKQLLAGNKEQELE